MSDAHEEARDVWLFANASIDGGIINFGRIGLGLGKLYVGG
jgi:hypothetical protein